MSWLWKGTGAIISIIHHYVLGTVLNALPTLPDLNFTSTSCAKWPVQSCDSKMKKNLCSQWLLLRRMLSPILGSDLSASLLPGSIGKCVEVPSRNLYWKCVDDAIMTSEYNMLLCVFKWKLCFIKQNEVVSGTCLGELTCVSVWVSVCVCARMHTGVWACPHPTHVEGWRNAKKGEAVTTQDGKH